MLAKLIKDEMFPPHQLTINYEYDILLRRLEESRNLGLL